MPRRSSANENAVAFDLKAQRMMRKLSQQAVATLLCSAQSSVARWEKEGNMPLAYRRIWELHWSLEDMKYEQESSKTTDGKLASVNETDRDIQECSSRRVMERRRTRVRRREGIAVKAGGSKVAKSYKNDD